MHEYFIGSLNGVENLVADNLFIGFLILIRRQQEILKYRLQKVAFYSMNSCRTQKEVMIEHESIKQCIKWHNSIYTGNILKIIF